MPNPKAASDSSNESIEVKIINAASDGHVVVTPEKCERIRLLLTSYLKAAILAIRPEDREIPTELPSDVESEDDPRWLRYKLACTSYNQALAVLDANLEQYLADNKT